jgi:hypothetical protein
MFYCRDAEEPKEISQKNVFSPEGAPQAEMPHLRWETILAVPCGPFRAHPDKKINPG